jgi:type I restriction enzyme S subunit
MNKFPTQRLDEFIADGSVLLGRGDVISRDDIEAHPGPYPIYSSSAHNNGKFGEYGKFMFDEELITWSVDGGGYFFYRPKHKYSVTNVCGYMRLRGEKLHPKFVYYSLANQHRHLTFDYTTKAHPSVIKKQYWLPTIAREQQQKIAAILTCIDTAIEKTEALIAKYQQIKAGLMHDLFTRGVTADGKLRPPREQAPELYQETPIGWIPREWEISGLRARAVPGIPHLRTGPFGSSLKGEHWVDEGHPVITIGALGEGTFIESELLYVGDVDANRLKDFQLKEGKVVFSRVADVGRSIVIREEQIGWIMSSNLMRISLDRKRVIPEILQQQLAFDDRLKRQIKAKVNSGGRDVANSEILNQLLFVWPQYLEQEMMVERAAAIDCQLRAEEDQLKKLEKQKLGLMHDLLTGKVRVKGN